MSAITTVIFDMDGVIVDSEPRHEQAFLEVVKEIGFAESHGLVFASYVGRSDYELWRDFVSQNRPKESLEQLLRMKRERILRILEAEEPLFEPVPKLVEELSSRFRLGLASGSERTVVDAVLQLKGLRRFFQATVSASEIEKGKPEPEIFLRTAELLGAAPEECMVIEDSKPGIAAGLAAKMQVIAITNTHPAEELRAAHQVVSSYAEIERILLKGSVSGISGARSPRSTR
jgi:HAD superfamily hydrolase (TIGR01509 family)